MTVAVDQRLAGDRCKRQAEPAVRRLGAEKLLEQESLRRELARLGILAQRQHFIAKGQKAARLEADNGHAAFDEWHRAPRPSGRVRALALATRPADRNVRPQQSGRRLSAGLGRWTRYPAAVSTRSAASRFSRSKLAVERIGEQDDFPAAFRPDRNVRGSKHITAPFRQIPARADPDELLRQAARRSRAGVAQIGERRDSVQPSARNAADRRCSRSRNVRPCVACPCRQHLDLHLGHVDAGGAFAPAGLAGDAKLQRIHHRVGCERVGTKLARRWRAAAYWPGRASRRAHRG